MRKIYLLTPLILFITLSNINLSGQAFTEMTSISLTGFGQGSVAWGDYNNDGYQDILMTGWTDFDQDAVIYKNNGDNTFTLQTTITLTGLFISSVAWADFDNDSDLDILITGTTSGNTLDSKTIIYRNENGTFVELTSTGLPGIYLSSVACSDYDRDGDIDILMTGMQTTGERISAIFNNNSGFSFSKLPGTTFMPVCYGYTSFGDYDNDGYPDVLVTGQTATFNRISKLYHNNGDGSFTEQTSVYLTGIYYNSGGWADFNSDGYLDIILTGEDATFTQITKIYINNKNGNFTELTGSTITGTKKGSISCGDYDNDGDIDFIISGDKSNIPTTRLYTNNGNSTFSENTSTVFTGLTESSISFCDYDNDKDLDLLLTGIDNGGTLISKIYRNNSSVANIKPAKPGNLAYTFDRTTVNLTWDKVSGDATSSSSLSYNVRMGLTATTTEKVSPQSDAAGLRKLTAMGNAQLNNKFIYKNLRWGITYYASVQALDNSFLGSDFSNAASFSITPQQPTRLTGNNISTTSIKLRWIRGNGDKCILFAREGTSGPSSPVNNTTYFANSNFGDGSPLGSTGWYCIYKGEADSVILTGLVPEKDYTIHAIEFQGSTGSETYATTTNPNNDNLGVFSPGIFTRLSGISMTGVGAASVAWGDYNNDGYLDILLTGQNIGKDGISKVYKNNGDNTFTEQTGILLKGVYYGSSSWGDYNNDDLLDIALTGYAADIPGPVTKIYKNNGDNTFTEQTGISMTGVSYSSIGWADYDNDGDLDLLITGQNSTGTPVSKIYRNDGSNTFTEQSGIALKGVNKSSVAWGDYNNDGYIDLLLSGLDQFSQNVTRVYRNNGNNTFTEQTGISLTGVSFSSVAWGDYNNDNNLDILITGASGYMPNYYPVTKIYRNNGNNTFTELTGLNIMGIYNGAAEWGDYNNDGLLDVLTIGDSGINFEFRIYLNNGQNGFQQLTALNLPGAIACSSSSADYDSDGDLDIVFAGYSGALLAEIYRNNLYLMAGKIKPNMRPEAPTGLQSEVTPGTLKLSWSGVKTDETFYVNMSYNIRCKMANDPFWKVAPQSSVDGYRSLNDLGNAQLNKNYTIKNPESGKYFWQVQAVDQSFSGSEWSKIDSVLIKTTQAFFKTDTVCVSLPTHFTDQSKSDDAISSWKWDFKDGATSTLQNPTHTYLLSGTYNVKLVITSSTGIKDSLQQNVIVKTRPKASFTAPNVCVGRPTTLTNTTTNNGLTISGWSWIYGDGATSNLEQPGTHTYPNKGIYRTQLISYANNGCADSVTNDVLIAGLPSSTITINGKLAFCKGDSIQLSAESDPNYTYVWKLDNNVQTNINTNTYNVKQFSGIYYAVITNTLASDCSTNSEQKTVTISPSPSVPKIKSDNYTEDKCLTGSPIKIYADQPVAAYNYQWYRNGTLINDATATYLEGFLKEGEYRIDADLNGCTVKSGLYIVKYNDAPPKPLVFVQEGPVLWYLVCSVNDAAKYFWYYNGTVIQGADKYTYVAGKNFGRYFVGIGDSKGCFTVSDEISIPSGTTGIEETDPFTGLKIYPNPSPGLFTIEMDNQLTGDLNISVISQSGKDILKIRFEKTTTHFSSLVDLSGQLKGMYFIKITIGKYNSNKKIVVE